MPYKYPIPFGEYQLIRRIAVGGMAEVFKAKRLGPKGYEKILAVKRILPEYGEDDEFVQMFVDEARISSMLVHNNIVQVFDFGEFNGAHFIAMEYVDGPNVRNVLQRLHRAKTRLPLRLALFTALQVSKALQYAHGVEIDGEKTLELVHRDVSPQNILISRQGEIKITDFGIAKAAIKVSRTQPGKIQGKYSYMSPEQALGKPLDRRSDIFSLGIVMYEMLSGEKLYQASETQKRYQQATEAKIPTLGDRIPDIPSDVDDLLKQMLQKDPAKRPQDMQTIIDVLDGLLASDTSESVNKELQALVDAHFPKDQTQPSAPKLQDMPSANVQSTETETSKKPADITKEIPPLKNFGDPRSVQDTTIAESKWESAPAPMKYTVLTFITLLLAAATWAAVSWIPWSQPDVVELNVDPKAIEEKQAQDPPPRELPLDDADAPETDKPFAEMQGPRQMEPLPSSQSIESYKGPTLEERIQELEMQIQEAEAKADDTQFELNQTKRDLKREMAAQAQLLKPPVCPEGMILLKSGTFVFGSSRNDPDRDELIEPHAQNKYLKAVCMDQFEYPNALGELPVVNVSWIDAQNLCQSQGKRLCSAYEWERACKGKATNRRFPYGDEYVSDRCNVGQEGKVRKLATSGEYNRCVSRGGFLDLSGNAAEWTLSPSEFNSENQVIKGGAFSSPSFKGRCSAYHEAPRPSKSADLGFRCCKKPS